MGKKKQGRGEQKVKVRRVNIELITPEEQDLYDDMKVYAAEDRIKVRRFVLELFRKEQHRRKSRTK